MDAAGVSCTEESSGESSTHVSQLTSPALFQVLSHFNSKKDVGDLLAARKATPLLRQAAADCIEALVAADGRLPDAAWAIFRKAKRLQINIGTNSTIEHKLQRLFDLLPRLPDRMEHIKTDTGATYLSSAQSSRLAEIILKSNFAQTLLQLHLDLSLSPAAVKTLLAGLQSLQLLIIGVGYHSGNGTSTITSPTQKALQTVPCKLAIPGNLHALTLWAQQPITLDCSNFTTATQLTSCTIPGPVRLQHATSLAALSNLQTLQLHDSQGATANDYWHILSALPKLTVAEVPQLTIHLQQNQPTTLPQLQKLTTLSLTLHNPHQQPPGCLVTALPQLVELDTRHSSLHQLATQFQGHSKLGFLTVLTPRTALQPLWITQPLRTLQGLRNLHWELMHPGFLDPQEQAALAAGAAATVAPDMDGFIADVSGCTALEHLHVLATERFTFRALHTLAAGACTRLEMLELGPGGCSLSAAAALFRGGLQQLTQLVVWGGKHRWAMAEDILELKRLRGALQPAKPVERAVQRAQLLADANPLIQAFLDATHSPATAAAAAAALPAALLGTSASDVLVDQQLLGIPALGGSIMAALPVKFAALEADLRAGLVAGVAEGLRLRAQLAEWLVQQRGVAIEGVRYQGCEVIVAMYD